MTSRFKVTAPKPVDEKAILGFNLRLTPSQMELINWVFERSTHKSKQKLIESILFPELERRRHELQERERAA